MVFDMDGVLTQHPSSWNYVHQRMGVNNEKNYELFRERKISYSDFLKSDVELWMSKAGRVSREYIESILAEIPFSRNLGRTISEIKSLGIKVAIVSGGISWLADMINKKVPFDYSFSNSISLNDDGTLIPGGFAQVDPFRKDLNVIRIQKMLGITRDETISVGDSEQDISMFRNSGISIGFNPASDEVVENADLSIKSDDLYTIITELDRFEAIE